MKEIFLLILLTCGLSGCGAVQDWFPSAPDQVARAETLLAAGYKAAQLYADPRMPLCNKPHIGMACADGKILVQAQLKRAALEITVLAAHEAATDSNIGALQTAMGAYQKIVDQMNVTNKAAALAPAPAAPGGN